MTSISAFLSLYTTSLLSMAIGISLGLVLERFVVHRLIRFSERTHWKSDDLIFRSMKGLVWLLFLIASIYLGIRFFPDFPARYAKYCDQGIKIAYILLVTIYISRILSRLVEMHTHDEEKKGRSSILVNLVRTVVFAVGIMVALQSLGISIQPLLTALGITGLAVALALQSTLSNFFSGLHIIATQKIRPGDYIRLEPGIEGYVTDINWRSATLQQLSNNLVIIPNSKLAEATVINTFMPSLPSWISIEVGVGYDSNLDQVERVCLQLAGEFIQADAACTKDVPPQVRFTRFGESGITLNIFFQVDLFPEQYQVRSKFIKMLHQRFREENIEIPYPTRTIIHKKEGSPDIES